MNNKRRIHVNIILNILIFLMIASAVYAWMITSPSRGKIIDYNKTLVIPSSDLIIVPYRFDEKVGDYVMDNGSPMNIGLTEPGKTQKYRFDITNTTDVTSIVNVVLSNITGNIDELKNVVYLGSNNPNYLFEKSVGDLITYDETSSIYSMNFISNLKIKAKSTLSFYWYTYIDQYASNEISNMQLNIDKIMFVQ